MSYEAGFAAHVGAAHAIAYGFARHALLGVFEGLGLGPGDEVVLPALTCKVVPLALLSRGLVPVYADVDPANLNLDPVSAHAALGSRTRAVVFQHTYGSALGLEAIRRLAEAQGVPLVEDRAQSPPSPLALAGRAAIYSNNLRKPLPAGSGGLATTDDPDLAEAVRRHRDQLPRARAHVDLARSLEAFAHRRLLRPTTYWLLNGLAQRLRSGYRSPGREQEIASEVCAPAHRPSAAEERRGVRWLGEAARWVAHRRVATAHYRAALETAPGVSVPQSSPDAALCYFPVRVADKAGLLEAARRERVEVVAWPISTAIFPVGREVDLEIYGYRAGRCPEADAIGSELVGLPTDLHHTEARREAVIALVTRHAARKALTSER